MRQEFENGIMVNVFDMKEGKGLFLSPPGKRATRVDLAHLPKDQAPRDLLDILKKLPDNPTKVLGEAQIEGRILQGFQWESTEGGRTTETTIWADPATRMPTVVDMKIHNGMLPQEIRMSEFQWDWPVEAALFSMEAPAGYAVSDGALDFAKPAEKDVVLALRASAAFNGGKFPEGLKLEQLVKAVASTGVAGQQVEAIMREQSLNILLSARGWAYISDPANGSDWHWAATGVTLGEKGRVVLWYRPVGKETYTVFDADLVVHTEAKAPEVASVKIEVGAR